MRRLPLAFCLLLGASWAAAPLPAQDLFSAAIQVGDRVVTNYELGQRERMLAFFGTPGDVAGEARRQLVEDRLKQAEMEREGVSLTPESLDQAVADLAAGNGLSTEELLAVVAEAGVEEDSLRDYVEVNAAWREYVRALYGERVEVTDADVEARLARDLTEAAGVEVLLSEIIIPAPPPEAAAAQARAEAISEVTTEAEFEAAARAYSATPSRERGGRLDWTPISNYPGALQDILLALGPGEVTDPLPLQGAVALLQLRGVREAAVPAAEPSLIDHAVVRLPAGDRAAAGRIAGGADACDDLYRVAAPYPVQRGEVAPAQVAPDVGLLLAGLDRGELTWGPGADGSLLLVMLCGREYALPEGVEDRAAVENAIRGGRLAAYSDALVADLRARTVIVGE